MGSGQGLLDENSCEAGGCDDTKSTIPRISRVRMKFLHPKRGNERWLVRVHRGLYYPVIWGS